MAVSRRLREKQILFSPTGSAADEPRTKALVPPLDHAATAQRECKGLPAVAGGVKLLAVGGQLAVVVRRHRLALLRNRPVALLQHVLFDAAVCSHIDRFKHRIRSEAVGLVGRHRRDGEGGKVGQGQGCAPHPVAFLSFSGAPRA